MDVTEAIKRVDSQRLSTTERNNAIASCRAFIMQLEASEALKDALSAEEPGFQRFTRTSLNRLHALLNAMSDDAGERINSLDMEPIPLIILGLCLSTKKIKRMSSDLWDEHVRQAEELSKRLHSLILANNDVADVIQLSTNEKFRLAFHQELQIRTQTSYTFSINGDQWYHYMISHAFRFRKLFDLAINRVVSVYLPKITNADCCIRFATSFNEDLLKALFEFSTDRYSVGMLTLLLL